MTYDLRRLRRKGFIVRTEGTHRYHLTPDGRRLAVFFTKVYARVLTPSLAHIDPTVPETIAARSPSRKGMALIRHRARSHHSGGSHRSLKLDSFVNVLPS